METERKLVTIRKINDIQSILNADFIELAIIDGWKVIVKKGDFSPGDFCVYFEIDSFLPVEDRYEFLRKSSFKRMGDEEGFRLKTIKLRGQISQGLALPFSFFPEEFPGPIVIPYKFRVGEDFTEELNVKLYERPIHSSLRGTIKGNLPSFIQKSSQPRIQNLLDYFEQHQDTEFEITEKLDGTSMTVYINNDVTGVCSRNLEVKETEGNIYWKIVNKLNLLENLKILKNTFGFNMAVQGELCGPGIQKNPYKLNECRFFIYDIWNIDKQHYIRPYDCLEICTCLSSLNKDITVHHIPIIYFCYKVFQNCRTIDELLKFFEGESMLNSNIEREGLVFKACDKQINFKVINNNYLLKEK